MLPKYWFSLLKIDDLAVFLEVMLQAELLVVFAATDLCLHGFEVLLEVVQAVLHIPQLQTEPRVVYVKRLDELHQLTNDSQCFDFLKLELP